MYELYMFAILADIISSVQMVTFTSTSRNQHKEVPRVSQTTNNGWKTINTKATAASINDKDENKWPGSADDQKDDDGDDEKPTV